MKVLICGGNQEADFVIRSFHHNRRNKIVVINDDEEIAKDLSNRYGIEVLDSDPTKLYSFEIADIYDFDLVIALMEKDADNFVCCHIAKDQFNIKKAICTVNDPNNVEFFEELGIDTAISASYLLTQRIEGESDIENITKTFSLQDDKIVITEITVLSTFECCNKSLMDLQLPRCGNITCIFRDPKVIIPRGDTIIKTGDNLVIASSPQDQKKLIRFIKKEKEENDESDQ